MFYKSIFLTQTKILGTMICRSPSLKMEKETTNHQLQKGKANIFELVQIHTHHHIALVYKIKNDMEAYVFSK